MNIIHIQELDFEYIASIMNKACEFKNNSTKKQPYNIANGYTLANVFFEPSTRTSLSFEVAMKNLGGHVITFHNDASSTKKGESILDTLKTISVYSDIIVLRHHDCDLIDQIPDIINKPIINAGNGSSEHPTQALLDLFTISQHIDIYSMRQLSILFVGDIKHSRTIHSLVYLLNSFFNSDIQYYCYPFCCDDNLMNNNNTVSSFDNIHNFDVVYSTRLQNERFDNLSHDIKTQSNLLINQSVVDKMKPGSILMHPLPRNHEIDPEVDNDPKCVYFSQIENGIYVRMAIIHSMIEQCSAKCPF